MFFRESAFNDERALRVLGELGTQIRNLEGSRTGLLKSLDPKSILQVDLNRLRLVVPDKPCKFSSNAGKGAAGSAGVRVRILNDCDSSVGGLSSLVCSRLSGEVALALSVPDSRLLSVSCDRGKGYNVVLRESFASAATRFVSQDFFDDALVMTSDGIVLGEFPMHDPARRDTQVEVQSPIADHLNILEARSLIRYERPSAGSADKRDTHPQSPTQSITDDEVRPVVTDQRIAGRAYRIYAMPFRDSELILLDNLDLRAVDEATKETSKSNRDADRAQAGAAKGSQEKTTEGGTEDAREKRQGYLYVVGVRRANLQDEIARTLWPVGLWTIALIATLSFFGWPLLSLQFGAAEESFSPWRSIGCALGVLVIPSLLMVGLASVWSRLGLEDWMIAQARTYAAQIESQLHQDLINGAKILESYRTIYRRYYHAPRSSTNSVSDSMAPCHGYHATTKQEDSPPLIGYDEGNRRIACLLSDSGAGTDTLRISAREPSADGAAWFPFRIVLATDEEGNRFGPVFSSFNIHIKRSLPLAQRAYFQALQLDQSWSFGNSKAPHIRFIAQRLFNLSDASKALQIAVPLGCEERTAQFCGIVTGDLRMHGLIESIAPPLLRFAVIDSVTGTVVFHSNDSRSLSENFFLETERNAELFAAIRAHRAGDFGGRYLGEPYSFYYRPLEDTPWGVVVFYPRRDLADLPVAAGTAALSIQAGVLILLGGLLVGYWLVTAIWPRMPTVKTLVLLAWPQRPLSPRYFRLSRYYPQIWALVVLLTAMLRGWTPLMSFGSAVLAMAVAAVLGFPSEAPDDKIRDATHIEQYVGCTLMVLTVVSILPAYCFFVAFEKMQLDALVRDNLVQSASQMQHRYDLIRDDLRRWAPPEEAEEGQSPTPIPDPWSLALHPDRGLLIARADMPAEFRIREAVPGEGSVDDSGFADRLLWTIWSASVFSPDQQRRVRLSEPPASRETHENAVHPEIQCGMPPGVTARCVVRMSDGSFLSLDQVTPLGRQTGHQQESQGLLARIAVPFVALVGLAGVALGTWYVVRLFVLRLIGLSASYADPNPRLERVSNRAAVKLTDREHFEKQWKSLDARERLALYQIASGHLVNPRNEAAMEQLIERGFIRERWFIRVGMSPLRRVCMPPQLRWKILGRFVLHSETPAVFNTWASVRSKSAWKAIRLPLLISLIAFVLWIAWSAGSTLEILSAVLGGTVALLGQITQIFNFGRSAAAPPPKDEQ